ncbi:MAG TPA: glycosyltransferase family 4 protein [Pyrinomonadaceae bacterium]|nr:glycosyltransferase family 4 protein [Pyrinomonadaceae bacterium]
MRILIVTHAPLSTEFGASQLAINLGAGLGAHGHGVTLWSPHPLPDGARWWQTLRAMRARLDKFLAAQESFDVLDCPANLITRRARRSATTVVARSVQPELSYLWASLTERKDRGVIKTLAYLPFESAYFLYNAALLLRGWGRAGRIACLGSLERQWMSRRFPWWRGKLSHYFVAPSEEDRRALAEVREARGRTAPDRLRFLWVGRWTAHKGPRVLLDFITRWHAERPQDTLTIAGCGAGAEKDCPAELLRTGTIKVIPSFKRAELYGLLAAHDIGLFTSKSEGWGLSLNEMLESGMPVFATRAGGVADLQSFFETLRPFPPTAEAGLITEGREVSDIYQRTFNWPQVAKTYVESLSEVGWLFQDEKSAAG